MKISLKDWKHLEVVITDLKNAIQHAEYEVFEIAMRNITLGVAEKDLITKIHRDMQDLAQQSSLLIDCHPQSEWTGGKSDDANNHRLREPNCCPAPRRLFTVEEIDEANLICVGPCQWASKTLLDDISKSNEELAS